MLFLHTLLCPLWFGLYKSSRMVDYQLNLEGWLENATLFPNEPVDYQFNFDELIQSQKANNETDHPIPGLSDLEWFDEKVDLSVLDDPDSLLIQPNEAETLMIEDAANMLLGLTNNSNFDVSYLSSDISKDAESELLNSVLHDFQSDVTSSENYEPNLSSPGCTTLQVNSPFFASPSPSPSGSSASIDDPPLELLNGDNCSQPGVVLPCSISSVLSPEPAAVVKVIICNPIADPEQNSFQPEEAVSIEEVTRSMRQKKFISSGKEVSKVHISLKKAFSPYEKATSKIKDRRARKKEQNKEAAARYRIKKRMEEQELSDEAEILQNDQKKLKQKYDDLSTEIKYLKSLMREILEKRGILK